MPLKLTLTEKLGNGCWKASGIATFKRSEASAEETAPAEILLQETADKAALKPVIDASVMVSQIMRKDVTFYKNAQPVAVKEIKKGAVVEINQIWFNLKNA